MTRDPAGTENPSQVAASFQVWLASHGGKRCRLVHFTGPNQLAKDVPLSDAMAEVRHLREEGFFVDWALHHDTVYLRVWEFGFETPPWQKVFSEIDLA